MSKVEVEYIKCSDDRFKTKGHCAYFFKDKQSGELYKWSTSYNNHYGICEGKIYLITFCQTDEIEDNAIKIKNVKIFEKLLDGEIKQKGNKRGTYKECM